MTEREHKGDILIVDDTPANLLVLANMLRHDGYKVRPLPSGELAIRAAMSQPPDLALLDINMPGMDGFEVCTRLHQDERMAGLPVIFISAMAEQLDKLRAFSIGGVDYITKPFHIEEVRARVRTHLGLRRLQLALEEQNLALTTANEKLRAVEAMRDNLTNMIVHDMRSPLTGILTSLQFLKEDTFELLPQDSREDVTIALESGRHLEAMIADLLDVDRMESGEMSIDRAPCPAPSLIEAAIASLGGLARESSIEVDCAPLEVDCDRSIVRRVLANMVGNAIKFSPRRSTIQVCAARQGDEVRFAVTDNGPGIPHIYREKIFEKFGQVKARAERAVASSGLGLTFCKMAVEAHGGRIGVDSVEGEGSTFWFTLPPGS